MNKTLLVMKNEVIATITRRSFLLTALGLPALSFIVLSVVSLLNRQAPDTLTGLLTATIQITGEGYVDEAGLIEQIPAVVPKGALVPFQSEAEAQAAMRSGRISGYYVIPPDFLTTGDIQSVRADFSPLTAFDQGGWIESALNLNLLQGDQDLAARFDSPLDLERISLSPEPERDEDSPLTFFVPYSVGLIFYTVILMSASFLLSSMTKEKENRVMEILMVSLTPRQLLTGKVVGLGIVGLVQTVLWAGTGWFHSCLYRG